MIVHTIGVDSAGHTYGSQNEHIERKLLETERMLEDLIARMDNQTTLMVFGDHGMT
jgi:GPI ethanolamine phosphate transferase 3 subunit O